MASFRYILPALAIAGGAAAATCSVSATTTLQSAADASALASCETFTGSIAIATSTSDTIDLSGINQITGDLVADSAKSLPEVMSTSLTSIGGTFLLSNLTILSSLVFPVLTSVESIDWNGLPALQGLTFADGISMATNLSIQNTFLGTLDGIDLKTVSTYLLANNNYLTSVNMQLGNVTESMIIQANGRDVTADFPNLIWAYYMDINNVTSFSIPSLASVNTSMYFNSDYFTSLSAPNVTTIGQDLSIIDCNDLTNVSFPLLTSIGGGLTIGDNSDLLIIEGFPLLSTIGGALDYHGNFTNATLPDITSIKGAFNMESTADITSTCSHFSSLAGSSNVIQGSYTCSGSVTDPSSGSATSTSSSTATSTSKAAANAVQIGAATGFLGVVAAIFGML